MELVSHSERDQREVTKMWRIGSYHIVYTTTSEERTIGNVTNSIDKASLMVLGSRKPIVLLERETRDGGEESSGYKVVRGGDLPSQVLNQIDEFPLEVREFLTKGYLERKGTRRH
jgi:hypothetical protein